jgi:uncharacterized protein YyaL (SSP411 family)
MKPTLLPGPLRVLPLVWLLTACAGDQEGAMSELPAGRNRLANETSPYLLQHADNPVDWYPWGEEAFARARAEDKPVLVSIGYSSCHWCHVMEHESFEDPDIAAVMNELFVCIKVDREERPDVDEVYMTATQLMGVGGGWPLNVFLTPDGVPFYGGTYFPPRSGFGRPSWPDLLRQVARAWSEQREQVVAQGKHVVEALDSTSDFPEAGRDPGKELVQRAVADAAARFDEINGGFGPAPKFPPGQLLRLLLRQHARTGDPQPLRMVDRTLDAIAAGGIHDRIGGGFHRYSVDERWLVPHFEKMLYDNAQLARVYTEAWQVTGDPRREAVARSTLDYVLRDMTEPAGGFRSATDADSEGREGIYFVWRQAEVRELLGDDAPLFEKAYGVTERGNFVDGHHPDDHGMNVLHETMSVEKLAAAEGLAADEVRDRLARCRGILRERRAGRVPPGLDDKILASWNALMIGSLAYAGRVFDEPRYVRAAERAAGFLLEDMRREDGELLRTHRGGESKIDAFLEDYAYLGNALLDLYEATFDLRWFRAAEDLAKRMDARFADAGRGGWFHTAADSEKLVARPRSPFDGATPSGNGEAARLLVRLAAFTGRTELRERAAEAVRSFGRALEGAPAGTVSLLLVLDSLLHEDGEIAFVGAKGAEDTEKLVRPVHRAFLPGTVIALLDPEERAAAEEAIPLLRGKGLVDGAEAMYMCKNFACQAPVTAVTEVEQAIAGS